MFLIKYALATIWPTVPATTPIPQMLIQKVDAETPIVRKLRRSGTPIARFRSGYFVRDSEGDNIPVEDLLVEWDEHEEDEEDWNIIDLQRRSKPIPVPKKKITQDDK